MGLEDRDTFMHGESDTGGIVSTTSYFQGQLLRVFAIDPDKEGENIFLLDPNEEKVGVISYRFYVDSGDDTQENLCYINFFGTQNGKKEKGSFKKLSSLSDIKTPIKGLSYKIMEKFIGELCHPKGIKRIYLDADSPAKKGFWKEKMGKYLLQQGLIKKIYSQGMEVCLVL